jgi:hypothetical protein
MGHDKEIQNANPEPDEWRIEVANPSSYARTDYVVVDIERLKVPEHLGKESLRLIRKWQYDIEQEIPYQIDYLFGEASLKRTLTFLSEDTPNGPEDYSQPTAEFILRKGTPQNFAHPQSIRVGH